MNSDSALGGGGKGGGEGMRMVMRRRRSSRRDRRGRQVLMEWLKGMGEDGEEESRKSKRDRLMKNG